MRRTMLAMTGLIVLVFAAAALGATHEAAEVAHGAAEAAHEAAGHGAEHHYDWMNLIFRVVNFAIFLGIIYMAAGKKIAEFFRSRREGIETELSDLSTRKETAVAKLSKVEASIADLEAEKARILASAREQGERMKAEIVAEAETKAAQITELAKKTAENESRQALAAIREEVAEMVAAAAEKMVTDKLSSKEEQEKLIDKYVTKVVLN